MAPDPSTPPVQTFELPEDAVANTVGIARREVAAQRGPQGDRWDYGPNRRVLWSAAGVAALRDAILSGKAAPAGAVELPPESEVLTVVRSGFVNSRVLLALRDRAGEPVTVYLGSNGTSRHFAPGMKILARPYRGAAWVFEANPEHPENGRRMPRAFGRW